MLKEGQIWTCPFCREDTIEVLFFPKTAIPQKGSWGGSKVWMKVSKETVIIQSGCSNCGKSKKEIEKALKEGTPEEKERKKKRYKEVMKLMEEMRRERESKSA